MLLDILRGIGIISVVIGHAIQVNLMDGDKCLIWSLILAYEMPLLFMLSGYSAGYSYPIDNLSQFIKKKVWRLLVPYIAWTTVYYILECIFLFEDMQKGVIGLFLEYLSSAFWFLRELFLFYVIIWIIGMVKKRFEIDFFEIDSVILSIIMIPLVFVCSKISIFSKSLSVYYYVWFVIGYMLYFLFKKRRMTELWNIIKNSRIVWNTAYCVLSLTLILGIYLNISDKWIAFIAILFLFTVSKLLEMYGKSCCIVKLLEKLGQNTLPIYAIHWCLLFSIPWHRGVYVKLFNSMPLMGSCMITALVWIAICCLVIKCMNAFKWSRKLFLGH